MFINTNLSMKAAHLQSVWFLNDRMCFTDSAWCTGKRIMLLYMWTVKCRARREKKNHSSREAGNRAYTTNLFFFPQPEKSFWIKYNLRIKKQSKWQKMGDERVAESYRHFLLSKALEVPLLTIRKCQILWHNDQATSMSLETWPNNH